MGSEMCIRDRGPGLRLGLLWRHGAEGEAWGPRAGEGAWQVERPVVEPQFIDCLLYTSDAADDLLCVDLGGRRILKKKTNK